jgi:hypothetical protein
MARKLLATRQDHMLLLKLLPLMFRRLELAQTPEAKSLAI